jgi:hypothetical protein
LVALIDTLPVSPPTNPIATEVDALVPAGTVSAVGDAEMVKFGSAVTFNVRVVVAVAVALVPVIVTVAGPTVAVFDAVKVSVLPAEPVTEAGLKLAVTPAGSPLALRATAPAKPLIAETVTLTDAEVPCCNEVPVAATLNPGAVVAGTTGNAF